MADGKVVYKISGDSSEYNKTVADTEKTAKDAFEGIKKSAEQSATGTNKLAESTSRLKEKIEILRSQIAKQKTVVSELSNKYGENNSETEKAKLKLIALEDQLANTEKKMGSLSSSVEETTDSVDEFNKEIDKTNDNVEKGADIITKTYKASMVALGAAMASIIGVGVKFNSEIESYTASFETMTGSAEKAVEITERLKEIGASTPFETADLAEATKLLMNYGLEADDAIDKMMMLGDISQGSADKLGRIATAYGQMSSAGKVSLEDIKQMIEAGFNPLQEISETTGESMSSLYDRISRGTITVDEITQAMERSTSAGGKYFGSMDRQSATLAGRFSTLKDTAGEAFGKMTQGITDFLRDDLLPAAINGLEWLGDNFQWLIPIVASATVGFTAFAVAVNMTKIINSVTTAMAALNAVIAANPVGLAVAAVAALVTGIIALFNVIQKNDPVVQFNNQLDEAKEKMDAANESGEELKKTFDENMTSVEGTSHAAEGWVKRLKELEQKTSLTTSEQAEWNTLLIKLKSAIPDVSELINDQTGEINGGVDALESYLENWKNAAKAEVYAQRIQEEVALLVEKEEALAEMQELVNEAMEKPGYAEQAEMLRLLSEQYGIAAESFVGLMAAFDQASITDPYLLGNPEEVQAINEQLQGLYSTYGDMIAQYGEAQVAVDLAQQEVDEHNASIDQTIIKAQEFTEAEANMQAAYVAEAETLNMTTEQYEEALSRRTEATQNAFEKIDSTIDLTAQQMIENLTENQALIEEWTQNLATLTERGLETGLIQVLEEAGPDAAATVAKLVKASDDEISKLNSVFNAGSEEAVAALMKTLELPDVQDSGKKTIDNAAKGVEKNKELKKEAKQTVVDTKKEMQNQVKSSRFESIGENIIDSVRKGLQNKRPSLLLTARSIAKEIETTINGALQANSPSKVMVKIGRNIDNSISIGMKKDKKSKQTSKELATSIIDTINTPKISSLTPTITMPNVLASGNATTYNNSNFTISKLADSITVRSQSDIDAISTALFQRILLEKRARGLSI